MCNYFPPKIKVIYTFPQDISFCRCKESAVLFRWGWISNWADSFSSVQSCTSPEKGKGRVVPALPQGKRKTFNKMRLDPRRAAVSTETPIQIPGGATSQSQLPCRKDPENRKGIHRTWGWGCGECPWSGLQCGADLGPSWQHRYLYSESPEVWNREKWTPWGL